MHPRRSAAPGDAGVYSVLYALLVVVLVGMGALVVDLATLRQERRASRSATDAAVTAGGIYLNQLAGIQPQLACQEAWRFAAVNVGVSPGGAPCGSFPATFSTCPTTASVATGSLQAYTVRITWPVPDTSPLMRNPTVQGGFEQPTDPDPEVDGDTTTDPTTPCTRIGVTLERTRRSVFAGIFGVAGSPVVSSSVARGLPKLSNPPSIAALNVLEEHECSVMRTSGQGFIQINAVPSSLGPIPGIINVESDGRPAGPTSTCPSSDPWVIDPLSNSLNYIRANGLMPDGVTQDPGKGFIRQFARNIPEGGNDAQAFDRALVPTVIAPLPTTLIGRSGVVPVTERYGETSAAGVGTPIHNLVTSLQTNTAVDVNGASVPVPYPDGQMPYNTEPFVQLPNAAYPDFQCTMTSPAVVVIPVGNWYLNCPPTGPNDIGLEVSNTLIFQGGNVVVEGGVQTKSFGCLVVNVSATTCPTTLDPTPVGDSILYLRNGQLIKGAQSQMFMPQTFTYIRDGIIDMGAGDGVLSWSRPKAIECAADPDPKACKYRRFGGLVLWSEGSDDHQLGGQSALSLIGVLFTPNTHFVYTGQPTQNQTQAQFWTREIEVKGQSGLIMAPDPEDAIETKSGGVALIR